MVPLEALLRAQYVLRLKYVELWHHRRRWYHRYLCRRWSRVSVPYVRSDIGAQQRRSTYKLAKWSDWCERRIHAD